MGTRQVLAMDQCILYDIVQRGVAFDHGQQRLDLILTSLTEGSKDNVEGVSSQSVLFSSAFPSGSTSAILGFIANAFDAGLGAVRTRSLLVALNTKH